MVEQLFSYGTLRQAEVQQVLFGRPVPTTGDVLPGFRLDHVLITDPAVIATSGSDRHPLLRRGSDADSVAGSCLDLTDEDLKAADEYEVDDYKRIAVTLASGRDAWVYVAADDS